MEHGAWCITTSAVDAKLFAPCALQKIPFPYKSKFYSTTWFIEIEFISNLNILYQKMNSNKCQWV